MPHCTCHKWPASRTVTGATLAESYVSPMLDEYVEVSGALSHGQQGFHRLRSSSLHCTMQSIFQARHTKRAHFEFPKSWSYRKIEIAICAWIFFLGGVEEPGLTSSTANISDVRLLCMMYVFWKGGGDRPRSGRPRAKPEPSYRGPGACPPQPNCEHLESLKWHFLHSEKAKCWILQFANNKILPFSE